MKGFNVLFVFVLLFGCSKNEAAIPTTLKGNYEDVYVQIHAEASLEEGIYEVNVDLQNRSERPIKLVYDCGVLIRYKNMPIPDECGSVYSESLASGETRELVAEIPTDQIHVSNGTMLIKIVYELEVGENRTIVGIPLTSKDK